MVSSFIEWWLSIASIRFALIFREQCLILLSSDYGRSLYH